MTPEVEAILASSRGRGWVTEPGARRILESYGLPAGGFLTALSPAEAVEGAESLGFPVAMKVVSPEIVHKSDRGGVAVGLTDAGAVEEAFRRMTALPGFEGVVIDRMRGGVELLIGAKEDPQFGTVVVVGIGGTAVELYGDVAIRMAPVTREEAANAVAGLRGSALLTGFRGSPPVDMAALADLLARFSEAARELGRAVESIDLNPVFCEPSGCAIADARMVLRAAP